MERLMLFLEEAANDGSRQLNDTMMSDLGGFQFQTNTTVSVINKLKFQKAKSLRTSVIILAAFNAFVGFVTAIGIFADCFKAAKRADPKFKLRSSLFQIIGPADIFPFVLSIGIMVQGIIFSVEQSAGMDSQLILGCESISQTVLPATFLVPFLQLVFGLEIAIRALRSRTFPRMARWTAPVCVFLVVVGLVGLYVMTLFERAPNFCFATLAFFIQRWKFETFVMLCVITGLLFFSTAITYTRLLTSNMVGPMERKAGSKMVYYMCIGIITNALIIPFYAVLTLGDFKATKHARFKLSMVSMVAANLTGITNGAIYLFLRSCQFGSIGRKGYYEVNRGQAKNKIRLWAPIYNRQVDEPVGPPMRSLSPESRFSLDNVSEVDEIIYSPKVISPQQPIASPPPVVGAVAEVPDNQVTEFSTAPEVVSVSSSPPRKSHVRKTSYSIFPQQQQPHQSVQSLQSQQPIPTTEVTRAPSNASWTSRYVDQQAYDREPSPERNASPDQDSVIPKPLSIVRHDRKSSIGSTATIQIGLRMSNIRELQRRGSSTYGPPPPQMYPSRLNTTFNEPPTPMRSTGPYTTDSKYSKWNESADVLPPVPPLPAGLSEEDNLLTLSPTVYSPDEGKRSKNTSPTDKNMAWTKPSDRGPIQTAEWI